jgi:hypothetical protein
MDFSDLFSNGKSGGPGPRCVDRAARSGPPWIDVARTKGRGGALPARGAQALGLAGAHRGRWRRGGVTEAKNGGGLSSVRGRRKVRRSSGERAKRSGEG